MYSGSPLRTMARGSSVPSIRSTRSSSARPGVESRYRTRDGSIPRASRRSHAPRHFEQSGLNQTVTSAATEASLSGSARDTSAGAAALRRRGGTGIPAGRGGGRSRGQRLRGGAAAGRGRRRARVRRPGRDHGRRGPRGPVGRGPDRGQAILRRRTGGERQLRVTLREPVDSALRASCPSRRLHL